MANPSPKVLRRLLSVGLVGIALAIYGANRDREFVSRPYLANPRARGVSILGFTRLPCRWSVVPLTPASPQGEERTPTCQHRIDLNNLPSNRMVEVQVLSEGKPVDGGRLRFRTEPGPDVKTFDFALVGDTGATPSRLRELWGYTPRPGAKSRSEVIVAKMSEARPQLILHAGDLAYPNGEREDYTRAFLRPFGPLIASIPIAAAIGNHDLKSEGGLPFLDVLAYPGAPPLSEGKYYSFNYGPMHVCVLNSNEEDFDMLPRQVEWARKDLSQANRPWRVVLCHIPLHTAGDAGDDTVSARQRQVTSELLRICIDYGVSVIFAGHHHWYERSLVPGGPMQIVSGGGGHAQPVPPGNYVVAASEYHFVRARIEGDVMTVHATTSEGGEIEGPEGVRIPRK